MPAEADKAGDQADSAVAPTAAAAAVATASDGTAEFISAGEVRRHSCRDSLWVVLHGDVYDLTAFLARHPGGEAPLLAAAGKDATAFWSTVHKREWLEEHMQPEWRLGRLDTSVGAEALEEHRAEAPRSAKVAGDVAYSPAEDPKKLKKRQYRSRPINPGLTFQAIDTMILLQSQPGRKGTLMDRIVDLVETRGDPNCTDQDGGGGSTPLHYAATLGSDEHVKRLLDANADPQYRTERDVGALHKFAARPMPDAFAPAVLTMLLDANCEVNCTMKQGRTPLHVAAQWGQADMCRLLLDKGAMLRARAGVDGTAADWARACVVDKVKLSAVLRVLQSA